jgi:anti-sigma factor ChrR (cupin superfamily)
VIDQLPASSCPHSELAAGWALHALEPAEESLVTAHLTDCPDCTRTVTDTEHVGATLGLSLPEMTPSPALEQRILAITDTVQATSAVPALPPAAVQLRRQGRKSLCVPEAITVLSVMLVVMALAAMIVFYLI